MELTYTLPAGMFEDDFPFPKVGYVSFLEGIIFLSYFKVRGDYPSYLPSQRIMG